MNKLKLDQEIKILKQNSVYRVADLFLFQGPRAGMDRKTILSDSMYRGTLMYDYLTQKNHERDYETFRKLVWQHIEQKNYQTAKEDELVVYMRLGDIMMGADALDERKRHRCVSRYTNFFEGVDLRDKLISQVVVVTALHFGANEINGKYFYDEVAKERSFQVVENFEKQTHEYGLPMRIVSNENVDADICFMSSAKFYVPGNFRMSGIIKRCLRKESEIF